MHCRVCDSTCGRCHHTAATEVPEHGKGHDLVGNMGMGRRAVLTLRQPWRASFVPTGLPGRVSVWGEALLQWPMRQALSYRISADLLSPVHPAQHPQL